MSSQTATALRAAWQPAQRVGPVKPRLIVAGATGVLGNEVLRRLAGSGQFGQTVVLAKELMTTSMAQVSIHEVAGDIRAWPRLPDSHDAGVDAGVGAVA